MQVERPQPFWNYSDLLLFVALAVPSFGVVGVLALALKQLAPDSPPGLFLIPAQFAGYALWFVLLSFMLRSRYRRPFWESLDWNWPGGRAVRFFTGGVLLAIAVAILGSLLRAPQIDSPIEQMMSHPLSGPLLAVAAVSVGPVCEELAFRGFMLPLLARSLGVVLGIVLSSLPFALLHGPEYSWSWRHVLLVMCAGAAFGYVRLSSGSTGAAALVHAGYNFTFIAAYFIGREFFGDPW